MKLQLTGVSETLLVPFYARVYGSRHYSDRFYDKVVLEVFPKIDYDFSKFTKGKMSLWGCLARSIILDREIKKFLKVYPDAKCINLACGFDTRFYRLDNGKIRWFEFDFSEVIALRKQIFPGNDRLFSLVGNVLEEKIYDNIKEAGENVLIILEGLLIYFTEQQVQELFQILKRNFPKATIFAEFSRPFSVKYQKYHDTVHETMAKFQWGIRNSKEIEKICPGVQFLEEWNLTEEMLPFSPCRLFLFSPFLKKVNNSIVKLQFKSTMKKE
ncbi:class I SAM-dependent methyltransferase [Fusobacterium necrophorum]|uniref:Leucine carboxyl methyltransferase n=1 Tax=Fusobacterium necrophorum DJ-2 TaxID=1441737 RepID=A0AB73C2R1_9FUSO|nr:class I SAM-dependent methyltransferase [Fusobacterium necrophorum]KDE61470.1 leucine carboxyl methyltransferase [Fusobacterium necrophorum DJ-1]KDE72161.1 leucine carboxyl methyltransferase [Fusobacterium necrophorum DJ-2]MBR8824062.1 hypothetical protein [Fusobacterium necrophorum]